MKVRMKHQVSGTRDGEVWPKPGETIVVSDDEAESLIAQGMAVRPGEDDDDEPSDSGDVPEGKVDDVLEWVGDDVDRAQAALDAERAGKERKSLVAELEAILEEAREAAAAKGSEAPAGAQAEAGADEGSAPAAGDGDAPS